MQIRELNERIGFVDSSLNILSSRVQVNDKKKCKEKKETKKELICNMLHERKKEKLFQHMTTSITHNFMTCLI